MEKKSKYVWYIAIGLCYERVVEWTVYEGPT